MTSMSIQLSTQDLALVVSLLTSEACLGTYKPEGLATGSYRDQVERTRRTIYTQILNQSTHSAEP